MIYKMAGTYINGTTVPAGTEALLEPMTSDKTSELDFTLMASVLSFFGKYFWLISVVFGIPGNILSFMICMLKENRKFSTCIYMAGLAFVDSIFLVAVTWIFPQLFHVNDAVAELQFQ
jgi:hypothetical protein